jgi:hypothetical protein
LAELAEAIGFIEVAAETEFEEAASERGIVVAAGRDDACIGVELFQRVITRFAAHAADDVEIDDDGVVWAADVEVALVKREGVVAVFRQVVFVVETIEHRGAEPGNGFVVIHKQDAASAETRRRGSVGLKTGRVLRAG